MFHSDTNEECNLRSSGSDTDISTNEYYIESDDDSDFLSCRDWKPLCLDNVPPAHLRFPFQLTQVGALVDTSNFTQETEYFDLFFDSNLLLTFTIETNRSAQQCILSQTIKLKSRVKWWVPTNESEIKIFHALYILQGIVKKPAVEIFWLRKECVKTAFFRNIMTYHRFQITKKYLHFVNNEDIDLL
ncbi:piggyBac transposable element-derived protein 4 [Nephila pilipes]|uniref:PiggyBac transposable element-derived protein 4 n=1 Tax=Nephila pilipes TaxID=299642 RepID=A0A8X6MQ24_NEPPI|nr:piggyBac transposable element-derived protein 4 [Nephila pilipes]